YSELGTRRTWFNIGVGYDTELKAAKRLLLDTVLKNEFAFKEPAPDVVVTELGDRASDLLVRVTTSNENFWARQEQLIIQCKEDLDKAGIEIPFPQPDIHIKKEKKGLLGNLSYISVLRGEKGLLDRPGDLNQDGKDKRMDQDLFRWSSAVETRHRIIVGIIFNNNFTKIRRGVSHTPATWI